MASQKQFLERKENVYSILEVLRNKGPKTRMELAEQLSLSWGCVSELISILKEDKLVCEEKCTECSGKGRNPSVLMLNERQCFVGIDANMMGLRGCVCNFLGEKINDYTGEINCNDEQALIDSIVGFAHHIMSNEKNVLGICVAMQGIFNNETQKWAFPGKEGYLYVNPRNALFEMFAIPVITEHDPNCMLYGCIGKEDASSKMLVRMDKGIGAALYCNKGFFANGALEISHTVVGEEGRRLHDVASINGLETLSGVSVDKLAEKAVTDSDARKLFENAGKNMGIALGNLSNLISLDEIIISGEMVQYSHLFMESLLKSYNSTVLKSEAAYIKTLNICDAAFGAAKLAAERYPL